MQEILLHYLCISKKQCTYYGVRNKNAFQLSQQLHPFYKICQSKLRKSKVNTLLPIIRNESTSLRCQWKQCWKKDKIKEFPHNHQSEKNPSNSPFEGKRVWNFSYLKLPYWASARPVSSLEDRRYILIIHLFKKKLLQDKSGLATPK